MYKYIKAKISEIDKNYIILDVNGIGYFINSSFLTITNVKLNEQYKIFTKMIVREDDISLYGFLYEEELKFFELLIGVSGIGAKGAIKILSSMNYNEIIKSILTNDEKTLIKLPSVGSKTAKRMILELKDKLKNYDLNEKLKEEKEFNNIDNKNQLKITEVREALISLGYSNQEINKKIKGIDFNQSVEEIILNALKR